MAAARNDSSSDLDPRIGQSSINIQFVDEDELPLAHVFEHRNSEDEFYSDESGSSKEDSDEQTSNKDRDEDMVNMLSSMLHQNFGILCWM